MRIASTSHTIARSYAAGSELLAHRLAKVLGRPLRMRELNDRAGLAFTVSTVSPVTKISAPGSPAPRSPGKKNHMDRPLAVMVKTPLAVVSVPGPDAFTRTDRCVASLVTRLTAAPVMSCLRFEKVLRISACLALSMVIGKSQTWPATNDWLNGGNGSRDGAPASAGLGAEAQRGRDTGNRDQSTSQFLLPNAASRRGSRSFPRRG
jgi:hypothetical protein